MTAISRTPQNTNFLQASKFLLTFDRIPNTQYFCQSVNIPGLSIGQAPINSPLLDYFAPGNKVTYNPFNITFLINGDGQSWKDIHDWFRSIASPVSFDERNRLTNQQSTRQNLKSYTDATLTVLSNLNNPILRVRFVNMFPITLSDIMFDTKQSADDVLTADASFMFEYFEFEKA
jgi:hypothetical protein